MPGRPLCREMRPQDAAAREPVVAQARQRYLKVMKLLCIVLLSLALGLVSSMDVAHEVSYAGAADAAYSESQHGDHGAAGMACCEGLSGSGAPCLGAVIKALAAVVQPVPEPKRLHLTTVFALTETGHAPGTPTGPPKV